MVVYTQDEMEFVSDEEAREFLMESGYSNSHMDICDSGVKVQVPVARYEEVKMKNTSKSTKYGVGSFTGNSLLYLYQETSGLRCKYGFISGQAREFGNYDDALLVAQAMTKKGMREWSVVKIR